MRRTASVGLSLACTKMNPASKTFRTLAREYLAHRRDCGYNLWSAGYALSAFARFADRIAPGEPLTIRLATQWAARRPASPVTIASRLSVIRGFARYCATIDSRTQIPPSHLTRGVGRRRAAHIFTRAQVRLILRRTERLEAWRTNLRPLTYRTFISLLECTGLRPCEARRLRDEDFDPMTRTLRVRGVKFSPGRTIPLHPSTERALKSYQQIRRARFPFTHHFFVGPFGRPLQGCAAAWTFRRLVRGIPSNGARARPRLYDFRHTSTHCPLGASIGSAGAPFSPAIALSWAQVFSTYLLVRAARTVCLAGGLQSIPEL
jgi:integrase/recombinase XerD